MIREFSAGGVVVRRFRGREFLCAVRVKNGTVLALPKGHIHAGETEADAAAREVREETGVTATLVEPLGPIRYFYVRSGQRVLKVVTFFLFRYRSGTVRDYQASEVDGAEWIPLEDAPRLLGYKGEREMAGAALSRLAASR